MNDRHSDLKRPSVSEIVGPGREPVGDSANSHGALDAAHARPRAMIEGMASGCDRAVYIGLHGRRNAPDTELRRRRDDVDPGIGGGPDPVASNEQGVWVAQVGKPRFHWIKLLYREGKLRFAPGWEASLAQNCWHLNACFQRLQRVKAARKISRQTSPGQSRLRS